jgi:uncharacterized UBP type Zn finger protein
VKHCSHLSLIKVTEPQYDYCVECVRSESKWHQLRMCLVCGVIGCCENSPNQHAKKHWLSTGHPLIQPVGIGQSWAWCYADEIYLERTR